ncbi:MAG: cation:proton antiporter [Kiritimatiellae bacterium]|nr:cation:proton antiporter [Kiritimatiellia bacterium]
MSESAFFQDLAVLMAVAGAVAVVFQKFQWPKVIGYILAGVLMSEHTWGGSFLADPNSVQTIGQLGVVFLMFTLGLEFSTGQMKKTKSVSGPMALVDTLVMIWLGYTVGRQVFGWDMVSSLFLGAAICDSATTLLAKTIDEMRWSGRPFVKYVLSTSVFEDVLCVGVIALITGVAHGQGMSLGAVGLSLGGLAVFFTCTVVVGLVLVPRLLTRVAKTGSDEALLLTALGCCFLISWIAYRLNYSVALGAFLVGVLGASSDVRKRLQSLAAPLRSMFAAVFFVTIGLLVNPAACWDNAGAILALSAVVMLGKGANCFTVGVLSGLGVKGGVQTAFGLAQIGEFAYMVALLFATCTKRTDSPMYQIVVGVSLITTCLNPLMLRVSDPVGTWAEKHLPRRLAEGLAAYYAWLERFRAASATSGLRHRLRGLAVWLAVAWVVVFAIGCAAGMLASCDYARFSAFFEAHKRAFITLAANVVFIAVLWPVWGVGGKAGDVVGEILVGASESGGEAGWRDAVRHVARFAVRLLVTGVSLAEVVMVDVNLLPPERSVRIGFLVLVVCLAVFGAKHFRRAAKSANARFAEALEAESRMARAAAEAKTFSLPGDNFLEVPVSGGSRAVGATIRELDVRAKTGASVVSVRRGGADARNPGPGWRFEAGDVVVAIGAPAQLAALRDLFNA